MHVRWGGVCSEPELKGRAHKQASKRPALRSQVSSLAEHRALGIAASPGSAGGLLRAGGAAGTPAPGLKQAA